jgi:hypothetical protein
LIITGRPFAPTTLTGFLGGITVGAVVAATLPFLAVDAGVAVAREPTGFDATVVATFGVTTGFVATTGGAAACFGFITSMAMPPTAAITATRAKI